MSKLEEAIASIDAANAEDPNTEEVEGEVRPAALLYGRRMSAWLERLRPGAPEPLRIAVRAQHIRRWERPRSDYSMDRKGYLKWRRDLQGFHAETTAALMERVGYGAETVARVDFLLRKRKLNRDPDSATLEDCACLVFLEHHLRDFATRTDRDKVVSILRKTWGKMSEEGRTWALKLPFDAESKRLIEEALAETEA